MHREDGEPRPAAILRIGWIGGNCPVQAEGDVDGAKVYFRARGDSWSLEIGDWCIRQPYGDEFDAGWMDVEQALALTILGAMRWAAGDAAVDGTPEDTDAGFTAQIARMQRQSRETMKALGRTGL